MVPADGEIGGGGKASGSDGAEAGALPSLERPVVSAAGRAGAGDGGSEGDKASGAAPDAPTPPAGEVEGGA